MLLSNTHNETIIVDIGGVYSLTHSLCYFALSVVGVVVFPGSLRVSDSRMLSMKKCSGTSLSENCFGLLTI